jgi:replicative DNA helicase
MNAAAGRAEIIIAKNRQGAIGTAVVAFSGSTTRFSDLDMSQPRYSYQ